MLFYLWLPNISRKLFKTFVIIFDVFFLILLSMIINKILCILFLEKKKEKCYNVVDEIRNHENGFHIMFDFSQWFTGVILILIHFKGFFPPIESHDCRSKVINEGYSLYIDCVDRSLTSIPQDIDKNLEILNISKNPIVELKDHDLDPYSELEELTMKELNITKSSANFFSPVQILKTLDISLTCFSETIPKLPISMERVIANSIMTFCAKGTLPILSELERLNEFEFRDNNLNDLPPLNIHAPIGYIDLSKNPMKNLTYTDIASLCGLSQFKLFDTDLSFSMYHQQCCGLQKWGEKYKIEINLQCDTSCEEVHFDADAVDAYVLCSNTIGSSFLSFDYLLFEILVFIAIVLSIGYLAFRHFKSDAVKEYKEKRAPKTYASEHEEDSMEETESIYEENHNQ